MALRQHSGTKLSIRRGKTRSATATPLLRGRVPIWRYGSCAGCSACSAKNPTLFHAEIAPDAGSLRTPTNDCRNNGLRTRERAHALNYGGTIIWNPSRRQIG